jgi:hypothetical protein
MPQTRTPSLSSGWPKRMPASPRLRSTLRPPA